MTNYYKFREEPFQLTPDPKFLHLAEPHRQGLTALMQMVVNRKGFLVTTGPIGTGKTTILHSGLQLLHTKFFPNDQLMSAFLVVPTLTASEFLDYLIEEFEVTCPVMATKPKKLSLLFSAFRAKAEQGGTAVILIDEAHLLSTELLEEVRLLSNLDTHKNKLVQIVLSGQPELNDLLAKPEMAALRQRIAVRSQLRPLSISETRSYVAERLQAAGCTKSPFTLTAVDALFCYSGGVPRVINILASTALSYGASHQASNITPEMIADAAASLEIHPVESLPKNPEPQKAAAKPVARIEEEKGKPMTKSPFEILSEALRQGRAAGGEL